MPGLTPSSPGSAFTNPQQQRSNIMQHKESWEALLLFGRANRSEDLLRKALALAELEHGENSPELGLCLMELADLLESQGNEEEAEICTARYREILSSIAQNRGLVE